MKILAVNPSSTQTLDTDVKQYLPEEIKPEDIIDKAEMNTEYDPDRKTYFLVKKMQLQPKETRTIEIRVKDVWFISSDELESTKTMMVQSLAALQNTKYYDTAKLLYDKAEETLTRIEDEEKSQLPIKQRIELYRSHVKQLESIKTSVFSMGNITKVKEEKDSGVREVKYIVTAENPSDQQIKMTVRSQLPKEITAEDVLDRQGFTLVYDDSYKRYAMEKEDTLGGKEVKKYTITLRDIWYIPQPKLDFLKNQTEKLVALFGGSPYMNFAKQRADYVLTTLNEIKQLQDELASSTAIEERMRAFVLNTQRVELVKKKIQELQDLLPELNLKAKEESELGQIRALLIKKLIDTKNLILVAMGVQPNRPITWWIFGGIVVFMSFFAGFFYLTWLKKLQEDKWTHKSPLDKQVDPNASIPPPEEPPQTPEKKAA